MSVTRKVGQDSTVVTFDQAIYDIVKRKSGYHKTRLSVF